MWMVAGIWYKSFGVHQLADGFGRKNPSGEPAFLVGI